MQFHNYILQGLFMLIKTHIIQNLYKKSFILQILNLNEKPIFKTLNIV